MKRVLNLLIGEGFRVFFLFAGLSGFGVMLVWAAYLIALAGGGFDLPVAMPASQWHAHELIFGYGAATLGGFFLTAVPNWTGAKAAPHRYIAIVAGLWLAGRCVVWASLGVPMWLVALVDLAFAPLLAAKIATQLLRKPKPQNMIFLLFLAYFWGANLMVHLDWMGLGGDAASGLRGGLMSLVGMIIVLGGRVTPAFTRNAMQRAAMISGVEPNMRAEPAAFTPIAIAFAAALPPLAMLPLPDWVAGAVSLAAGVFVLIRVAFWHTGFQWTQPILWTLHLSYAAIGAGLVLKGLVPFTGLTELASLHFLAIGGVGGMTLSVMSRASLGHAGRALIAPRGVVLGYGLVPLAAVIRWLGGEMGGAVYDASIWLSSALWLVAFGGFLIAFAPIYLTPRAPRAPVGAPPAE